MAKWIATYDSAKTIREIIASIAEIVEEGNFYVKEDSLEFSAMDESRVAMAILKIPRTTFQSYEFEVEEGKDALVLGVNFSDLKKIMRRGGAKDSIMLSLKKYKDKQYFSVTFYREGVDEKTMQRTFSLPLLDIPEERINIGKLEYDVIVEFSPAKFFNDIIGDAKTVGEDLRISANMDKKEIRFLAESETGEYYEYIAKLESEETVVNWEIKDNAESLYSLEFLNKMTKAAKIADLVRLEYSQEKPIKVTYMIGGGIELIYLLAPRLL
ncbi:MAG: proliferating cell nuclear antigen (pcna) [Candidatus Njordarchaeia archaeon]